jgi:hypothetical protein
MRRLAIPSLRIIFVQRLGISPNNPSESVADCGRGVANGFCGPLAEAGRPCRCPKGKELRLGWIIRGGIGVGVLGTHVASRCETVVIGRVESGSDLVAKVYMIPCGTSNLLYFI